MVVANNNRRRRGQPSDCTKTCNFLMQIGFRMHTGDVIGSIVVGMLLPLYNCHWNSWWTIGLPNLMLSTQYDIDAINCLPGSQLRDRLSTCTYEYLSCDDDVVINSWAPAYHCNCMSMADSIVGICGRLISCRSTVNSVVSSPQTSGR